MNWRRCTRCAPRSGWVRLSASSSVRTCPPAVAFNRSGSCGCWHFSPASAMFRRSRRSASPRATTARARRLNCGLIEPGRAADFVILDRGTAFGRARSPRQYPQGRPPRDRHGHHRRADPYRSLTQYTACYRPARDRQAIVRALIRDSATVREWSLQAYANSPVLCCVATWCPFSSDLRLLRCDLWGDLRVSRRIQCGKPSFIEFYRS